ncbi:MAG: HAD hydrolase-like protein [Magnetococcales bacterium]|nr:HAD hydrolase-like protein [Magnetococcales bacterium]
MDGTLLDLHFDDHFFRQTVPQAYAVKFGVDFDCAWQQVISAYHEQQGTLAWYDLDHWSQRLGLDIPLLKEQVAHLIRVHPYVLPFLEALQASGRPVHLVTNAHPYSLEMKLARTPIGAYLTSAITSHEVGWAKEQAEFWPALQARLGFDPVTTVLVDDSEPVLTAARNYGLGHVRQVLLPNSSSPPNPGGGFPAVMDFRDLGVPVEWSGDEVA